MNFFNASFFRDIDSEDIEREERGIEIKNWNYVRCA